MQTSTRSKYFDQYWQEQDGARVSARAMWRAEQISSALIRHYSELLDAGAGQGELSIYFRDKGYEVEVWDVSAATVESLAKAGFRARLVDLDKEKVKGCYPLICCCEMLQQVETPFKVIRKLDAILAVDGRLVISVPNEYHVLRRFGMGKPSRSHLTLFSPRKARALIRQCELTIERMIPQPLTPPRWGRLAGVIGKILTRLSPSLFSLSNIFILKRLDDY